MATIFPNANHFSVNNSTFVQNNNVGSDDHYYQRLLDHRALEATHQSTTGVSAPKCNPRTRLKVIKDIENLVARSRQPIVWLSGPAGGGKTCIQREIARKAQEKSDVVVSYFFSTRVPGLNHAKPFVATIVYQLVKKLAPDYKARVIQVLKDEPDIFESSPDNQLEQLIINPLSTLVTDPLCDIRGKLKVIIDGLDECINVIERKHILRLIHTLANHSAFPFRVVVASRPEQDIRNEFESGGLSQSAAIIRLENYNAGKDIRAYLCDEIYRIRQHHPAKSSIAENWPNESEISKVVSKASSQFIYASTVIKYLERPRTNPILSLAQVLSSTVVVDPNSPFGELDALYNLILTGSGLDMSVLKTLLHVIMDCDNVEPWYIPLEEWIVRSQLSHTRFLDNFLAFDAGETEMVLSDLHAIIYVPPTRRTLDNQGDIRFHHKSLEDYLRSQERAKVLYQPQDQTFAYLAEQCMNYFRGFSKLQEDSSDILNYVYHYWPKYMVALVQARSPFLSRSLLSFDPGILLHHFCRETFAGRRLDFPLVTYALGKLQMTVHSTECHHPFWCRTLCRRLRRIYENKYAVAGIFKEMHNRNIDPDEESVDEAMRRIDRLIFSRWDLRKARKFPGFSNPS